ncbi:MAG: ABC transporter ATP-binding protein [Clostridia bacterium]|nr:ABC transporter ATP-binding protein [Clostridia bacterium]
MIEVKNLVKRYGDFEAVRGVSFTVQKGMIYGFLGPNGAGKSTTMNIITGTLAATEGEVTVNGCDIYEDPIGAKSAIGYLPEQPPLYPDMTPEEYLAFVGEARGLRGDELWRAIDRVVEKTGLGEYANRLIKNLSKGYRQRVGIAQAILTDPEIIILDEPTVGLDPRQIIEIRELIRQLGRDHTVILSSHILTEISAVCDYVIIIARGKIVASDTLENLTKQYEGKNYIDLTVRGEEASVRRAVESIPGVEEISVDPKPLGLLHVRIATDSSADIREDVFFRFADAKMPILSMEYEEVTLEKVFLELTGEKADSQPAVEPPVNAPQAEETGEVPAEEETPAPEPEAIPAEEPAPAKQQKAKKSGDDDDYTPLFGG